MPVLADLLIRAPRAVTGLAAEPERPLAVAVTNGTITAVEPLYAPTLTSRDTLELSPADVLMPALLAPPLHLSAPSPPSATPAPRRRRPRRPPRPPPPGTPPVRATAATATPATWPPAPAAGRTWPWPRSSRRPGPPAATRTSCTCPAPTRCP